MINTKEIQLVGAEFLTVATAAIYLSMSKRTVYALLKDHVDPLPHFRRGRLIRLKRSELDDWMGRHRALDHLEIDKLVDALI